MYPRITCDCGNPHIGLVYNLYIHLKIEKYKKFFLERHKSNALDKKTPAELLAYINRMSDMEFSTGDILDMLQVTKDCCRAKLFTNREFIEFY